MAKEKDEKTKAQDEAQADAKQLVNQQDPTKQAVDDIHAQQVRQAGQDFDDLDNRQDGTQGQYNPLAIGIAPQAGAPAWHNPNNNQPNGYQPANPGDQAPINGGAQGPNAQDPSLQGP